MIVDAEKKFKEGRIDEKIYQQLLARSKILE